MRAPSDDAGESADPAGGPPRFSWDGHIRRDRQDSCITFPPRGPNEQIRVGIGPDPALPTRITSDTPAGRDSQQILLLDDEVDPGTVVLTCANDSGNGSSDCVRALHRLARGRRCGYCNEAVSAANPPSSRRRSSSCRGHRQDARPSRSFVLANRSNWRRCGPALIPSYSFSLWTLAVPVGP
jgi:hypothetical protein